MRPLHNLGRCALLAIALLLAPAALPAREDRASAPAVEPRSTPVPLLWKLTRADNTVYLLGSFHLLKPADYPLSRDIDAAFALADRLVFEVPPAQLSDPATAQKFMRAAGYADGGSLSAVLPTPLHAKLDRLLAQRGGAADQVDAFEPWFVNLSLVLGLSQSLGFSGEHGLDQHLMRAAAAAGKPTGGLETIDDQLQALDAAPMHEQLASLADFLERADAMPATLGELHAAWRNGDLVALNRLAREQMQERTPETYRLINVARNEKWLPQIRAMLDTGTAHDTLVVVGTLHLIGADGLVARLRDHGYEVERICSACAAANDD